MIEFFFIPEQNHFIFYLGKTFTSIEAELREKSPKGHIHYKIFLKRSDLSFLKKRNPNYVSKSLEFLTSTVNYFRF